MLKLHNIECPIVTGGGTGTFPFEIEGKVHNELQPGSFLFMDNDYAANMLGKSDNSVTAHPSLAIRW